VVAEYFWLSKQENIRKITILFQNACIEIQSGLQIAIFDVWIAQSSVESSLYIDLSGSVLCAEKYFSDYRMAKLKLAFESMSGVEIRKPKQTHLLLPYFYSFFHSFSFCLKCKTQFLRQKEKVNVSWNCQPRNTSVQFAG